MFLPAMLRDQKGAVAILTAFSIVILIGFAALAIDIANLLAAKNELQNAADAAALAGAQVLYLEDGSAVNPGANEVAYETAIAHLSQGVAIETGEDYASNTGDIQRGHWNWISHTFVDNASTLPTELWDVSDEQLAEDTDFINAVRVAVRRQGTPVTAFFARIFGYEGFVLEASAVAWIGFAGSIEAYDVDLPFTLCAQAITHDQSVHGKYTCDYGRTTNSGNNADTFNTAAWANLDQDGGANTNDIRPFIDRPVCEGGNTDPIFFNLGLSATGGAVQPLYDDLVYCWEKITNKSTLWKVTLPVIDCGDSRNPSGRLGLVGVLTLYIVWAKDNASVSQYDDIPVEMEGVPEMGISDWSQSADCLVDADGNSIDLGTAEGREACWISFAKHFRLNSVYSNNTPADFMKNTIYFIPDCSPHKPIGNSSMNNFGILAKHPVLVQ